MIKTEYKRVKELADIFDEYWVPFEYTELKSEVGVNVSKLVDEKSGDVYLERYDPTIDTYTVYKFDKWSVPTEWSPEEDSTYTIKV